MNRSPLGESNQQVRNGCLGTATLSALRHLGAPARQLVALSMPSSEETTPMANGLTPKERTSLTRTLEKLDAVGTTHWFLYGKEGRQILDLTKRIR